MTTIAKLYARTLANKRGLSFRDFERLLHAFGFVHERTVGSHRQYVHPAISRPLPVQPAGKDAKLYQVREFLDMVAEHRLSMSE